MLDGEREVVIASVADGAGSSRFSKEGSSLVCEIFDREVREILSEEASLDRLDAEFGRMFLEYCQEQLRPRAEERGEDLREFASTFIGCVICPSEAVFFQLGDGGVIYSAREAPDSYFMAIPSLPGEYANVTEFVTDTTALAKLRFSRVSLSLTRVALFSDGLQNLAVDYRSDDHGIPFPGFFNPMFASIHGASSQEFLTERLHEFLASDAVNLRTDDDKTLVLISQNEPEVLQ